MDSTESIETTLNFTGRRTARVVGTAEGIAAELPDNPLSPDEAAVLAKAIAIAGAESRRLQLLDIRREQRQIMASPGTLDAIGRAATAALKGQG